MKTIILSFAAGLLIVACNQNPGVYSDTENEKQVLLSEDSVRDGAFIHISHGYDDPHRVLMALKMAAVMADDKDVIVYMDIHAVELLVNGAKDLEFSDFESFQTYLKLLVNKGTGVYACPTCLKIAGFNSEDLMKGIQVAQKDKFFNFTKGRIITLDY